MVAEVVTNIFEDHFRRLVAALDKGEARAAGRGHPSVSLSRFQVPNHPPRRPAGTPRFLQVFNPSNFGSGYGLGPSAAGRSESAGHGLTRAAGRLPLIVISAQP